MHNKLLVGRILKSIGLNGLVKIQSYMLSPKTFLKYTTFSDKKDRKVEFSTLKFAEKDKLFGAITGVTNRSEADKYRLLDLYLDKSELPPLSENEYYFEDLKGLSVYDENNEPLGVVRSAFDYGAGAFLEILTEDGKCATIPFNENAIVRVDLSTGKILANKRYLLQ